MKHIQIEESAFTELQNLVADGFVFNLTKAIDDTDIVLVEKTTVNGHWYRMFSVNIVEE